MRNLKYWFSLSLTLLAFQSQAHIDDVYGNSAYYIKVTEDISKSNVKFELCHLRNLVPCKNLGQQEYYAKIDLVNQKKSEKWDVVKSILADVGIIAGTTVSGGALAYVMTSTGGIAATVYGTMAGASAGGTVGGVAAIKFKALNPYEQYKQLETIDENVLADRDVNIDYDVVKFAQRLSTVLDNLNSN